MFTLLPEESDNQRPNPESQDKPEGFIVNLHIIEWNSRLLDNMCSTELVAQIYFTHLNIIWLFLTVQV